METVARKRHQKSFNSSDKIACFGLSLKEVEKYRSGYNQVRYECIRLQAQVEQQRKEHAHSLESQTRLYQAEVLLFSLEALFFSS